MKKIILTDVIRPRISSGVTNCRIVARMMVLIVSAAPVRLNIVCFRYVGGGAQDEARLEALNEEILLQLQESGVAILTSTRIHGRFALRAAITNHRSRREDFELVSTKVQEIGRRLDAGALRR